MSVIEGWLVPHPPLILPEVGRGRQNEIIDTVNSYRTMASEVADAAPDTIVVVSPHSHMYADYIHISPGSGAVGNMKNFGTHGVEIKAEYDAEFVEILSLECVAEGLNAGTMGERDSSLDHGASIPVSFINDVFSNAKYVRAGISGLSVADHYLFGEMIARVSELLGRKTIVVASGDLSHKLLAGGSYGYAPEGPEFDRIVCEVAKNADFSLLFDMDGVFCEKAGECGHRPLLVMAGALDRKAVSAKLYSYEGPFGVGYAVASFKAAGDCENRDFLDQYLDNTKKQAAERRNVESEQVALARKTVENYVRTRRLYKEPESLPDTLTKERAGVFVSIKKHGELRGCIGTIDPVTGSVGEEIRSNAVSASTRDPRFEAITEEELPFLEYSVDVLAPAEPAESAEELDPYRYGVIVSLGGKRGLLLPDLEGIDDAETQISIAMKKAGIPERDRSRVRLERFEVIRYR